MTTATQTPGRTIASAIAAMFLAAACLIAAAGPARASNTASTGISISSIVRAA